MAIGLVDVIEGELVGQVVYEAHCLTRQAAPGETRYAPVLDAVCAQHLR